MTMTLVTIKQVMLFDEASGKIYSNGAELGRLNYNERLLFSMLITERNKIIPKDALLAAGWPERIVVPNSLNIAIRNIRSVLERAGVYNEPETVPKMGYRLGVEIAFIEGEPDAAPQIVEPSTLNEIEQPSIDIRHRANDSQDTHHENAFNLFPFLKVFLGKILSIIYPIYVGFFCLLSLYIYSARLISEPDFSCILYDNFNFCGDHQIERADIPLEFFSKTNGGTYWFTERENEILFFNVD